MLLAVALATSLISCKGRYNSAGSADSVVQVIPADTSPVKPPVVMAPDDSLTMKVKEAVKDYAGVTATINNHEVILTGTIAKDSIAKLLDAVNATHPKKLVNNVTVK